MENNNDIDPRDLEALVARNLTGEPMDRYGREWPFPTEELCPECGQPDSCGDCNHERLTDEEVVELLGEDS